MSNRDTRMGIFDRLSGELTSLIPEAAGRYCCPICLGLFKRTEAGQVLTLEHIIPDGLGKRLLTLTCKTCNNDVGGAKLDSHLHMKLALESFFKGSGKPVAVEIKIGEHRLAANWERTTSKDGVSNNFKIVGQATAPTAEQGSKEVMQKVSKGDELDVKFRIASEKRANVSLLKSGYLLVFKELGYRFILHKNLDPVRQQIQRPAEGLLPIDALVVGASDPSAVNCVMEITDPRDIDGMLVCLEIRNPKGATLHRGVLLPTPASQSGFFERARALKERAGPRIKFKGRRLQSNWANKRDRSAL